MSPKTGDENSDNTLVDIMKDIRKKLLEMLNDLWWCDQGKSIYVSLTIARDANAVETINVSLDMIPRVLGENIRLLETQEFIDPYVQNIITGAMIELCRFVSAIEATDNLIKRAQKLLKVAENESAPKNIIKRSSRDNCCLHIYPNTDL